MPDKVTHLILVLGDQLTTDLPVFKHAQPSNTVVLMAEVVQESTKVWSHQSRTAYFLSAMRHFAQRLGDSSWQVDYIELDDPNNTGSLASELTRAIERWQPQEVLWTESGEYNVTESIKQALTTAELSHTCHPDTTFIATLDTFRKWAKGRKQLRMEYFYRLLREQTGVLMDGKEPVGGQWNYDKDNRLPFGKSGPGPMPRLARFEPDTTTQDVIALVKQHFKDHPGSKHNCLDHFDWPVTPEAAQTTLDDFIERALPQFGPHQDAMWTDEAFLYHSRLSAAINLKLIDPMTVIRAAEAAYEKGHAPIESVEGFIRQILGWREFVRGMYDHYMPNILNQNYLEATHPLPDFYWTGQTDMNCLKQTVTQTMTYGYAHHIQRLMVTGLFALLLGVEPKAIHEWYLAVYVDAIEWVELPNTLGMSQFVDGGVLASKPYVASGNYISKMSNYCKACPYNPKEASGDSACPFTTLYWDFLSRHYDKLKTNARMGMQLRNLERKNQEELDAIRQHADHLIRTHFYEKTLL